MDCKQIRLILALAAFSLCSLACEDEFETSIELGVSSRAVTLTKAAGSTPVMVYSTGDWSLSLEQEVQWASIDRVEGSGIDQFTFTYTYNFGVSRTATVYVDKGSLRDSIVFTQAGNVSAPSIEFSSATVNLLGSAAADISAEFTTNIPYDFYIVGARVTFYTDGEQEGDPVEIDWDSGETGSWVTINSITWDATGVLNYTVAANTSGSVRKAEITLYTPSIDGVTASATQTVTQTESVSFEEVRAMTPGTLTSLKYIEGYVVSDPDSPNVCSSPQTGRWAYDRSQNDKTVYIESEDGVYGFRLEFDEEEDNTLERFSMARIAIGGATLTKNDDPEYYILSGLTADNIIGSDEPDESAIPVKTRKISELTDDDIFTLVTVTDLEIMDKEGSYTNWRDALYTYQDDVNPNGSSSAARWDVAPLLMYDKYGDSIFMLTNAACPWRRDGTDATSLDWGSVVKQGSGSFTGIVDSDDIVTNRYGDCGRYQLRAMSEDDIALDDEPFSTTIVEWTWNDQVSDLTPEYGTGTFEPYLTSYSTYYDYNNTCLDGLAANCCIYFTQCWWDFDNEVGKYMDISFSTANISGTNLFLGLSWGHNPEAISPSHWNLLYSTDGENFSEVNEGDILKKRAFFIWYTAQDHAPGFTEIFRTLPSDCFGQDNVTLRLQVADTVADSNEYDGASSNDWTEDLVVERSELVEGSTYSRTMFGMITVRYN